MQHCNLLRTPVSTQPANLGVPWLPAGMDASRRGSHWQVRQGFAKLGLMVSVIRQEVTDCHIDEAPMRNLKLDRIDHLLLEALQQDARLTTAELAERVNLSPSPAPAAYAGLSRRA